MRDSLPLVVLTGVRTSSRITGPTRLYSQSYPDRDGAENGPAELAKRPLLDRVPHGEPLAFTKADRRAPDVLCQDDFPRVTSPSRRRGEAQPVLVEGGAGQVALVVDDGGNHPRRDGFRVEASG